MGLSETPVDYEKAPPKLGDATEKVLSDILKLSDADITGLRKAGTIG